MNVGLRPWNVLSLCSGIGGLDLGLKLAAPTSRTVCYVEREAFAAEVLVTHMQAGRLDAAPIWTDLKTFDGKPWRKVVDCVVGGFPCQPVSCAGKRLGADDERWLWPEFLRIAVECEVPWIFWENVPGILSKGFRGIVADLGNAGYRVETPTGVPTFGLFSAEEVGAPHRRERVFCLAYSERFSPERYGKARNLAREKSKPQSQIQYASLDSVDDLADSDDGRCQGVRSSEYPYGDQAFWNNTDGSCSSRRVLKWPPKPGADWRRVSEQYKSFEPALCRVAHGIPDRVDRLRALGNGVVPNVAAKAFSVLTKILAVSAELG